MTPEDAPEPTIDATRPPVEGGRSGVSRSTFLGRAGLLVGGLVAGGALGAGIDHAATSGTTVNASDVGTFAFDGAHQAGIATPSQSRMHGAAFDVSPGATRTDLIALLTAWTNAARRMTAGELAQEPDGNAAAPPTDTGEAEGLPARGLTITFGFGRSLFTRVGDPFGIAKQLPAALVTMPAFSGDELQAARSDGDLFVQACADDPQVAFHAVRNLARIGRDSAAMRWTQLGFGRTSGRGAGGTPRNLMGFKDGTNNITAGDSGFAQHVWATGSDGADWMAGGSYAVTRRIRMTIEAWDRAPLAEQQNTIGRAKATGAPLGQVHEHDTVDLQGPAIPARAHIRLASHATNHGVRILRRGFSYTDGVDPVTGELDAGLFFIAFQRDPRTGFIPLQRRLGDMDLLNEYVVHTSSALFACPPGTKPGGFVGDTLLA